MDKEIECMGKITEALSGIDDPETVKRILNWVNQKYLGTLVHEMPKTPHGFQQSNSVNSSSLDGIAMLTQNGDVKLTVRDLKGRSAVDSAIRLIQLMIYSHEVLKDEKWVSSRKVITPTLKDHRLYTGSIRAAIAKHKGVVRDGDLLGLDQVSRAETELLIEELKA